MGSFAATTSGLHRNEHAKLTGPSSQMLQGGLRSEGPAEGLSLGEIDTEGEIDADGLFDGSILRMLG